MLIVALPGGAHLSAALARALRCDWTELVLHRFPDGETLVRIDAPVKGRHVVLAGSLHQPNDKTLALLFAADAARELGAVQVGLVAPYLAYMRQDKRFHRGEAITSRSYARLLSSCLDFLVTVDPHLHRWPSLDAIYPIRTLVVPAAPAIARWIRHHHPNRVLVGPDAESTQWVSEVARLAGVACAVLAKTRRGDRDVRITGTGLAAHRHLTPILLDDIISTGQTLVAAADVLKAAGLAPPVCIGVHALFEAEASSRLLAAGVAQVVTCDTIAHPTNAIALTAHLARAVRSQVP